MFELPLVFKYISSQKFKNFKPSSVVDLSPVIVFGIKYVINRDNYCSSSKVILLSIYI
jgi:hypothetical protein